MRAKVQLKRLQTLLNLWVSSLKTILSFDHDIPVVDTLARMYFSYLYIPIIATALVFLFNTALHCTYHLLVPLSGGGYWMLATHVPPYAYGTLVLIFLGYRLLTVVADTMVDCFYSQGSDQYYYLRNRLEKCVAKHPRWFCLVGGSVSVAAIWISLWFLTAGSKLIMIAQVVFAGIVYKQHYDTPSSTFFEDFWPWVVPKVRDASFGLVTTKFLIDICIADIPSAADFALETSIQLLIPHITLHLIAALTLSIGDFFNALSWVRSNTEYLLELSLLSGTHFIWGIWTVLYLPGADTIVISSLAMCTHLTRSVTVLRKNKNPVPLVFSKHKMKILKQLALDAAQILLLKSLLEPFNGTDRERKQFRWRIRFRRLIRILGATGLSIIFGLSISALAQGLYGGMGQSSAHFAKHEGGFTVTHILTNLNFTTLPVDGAGMEGYSNTDRYPVLCNRTWKGVGAFDLALYSMGSYLNATDFALLVKEMNSLGVDDHSDWFVRSETTSEGINKASYYEVHSPTRNLSIFSIRGTNPLSFLDLLQDVFMYIEVATYQILSHVFPFFGLFPRTLIADGIYASSITENLAVYNFGRKERLRYYWEHVLTAVEQRKSEGVDVLLTGHSLGASISMIAGSRSECLAVGFHGPGILLSHKKFGITDPSLVHRHAVNIIPDKDFVPLIDLQGGELHHLPCALSRHDSCHLLESTITVLWQSCPSVRSNTGFTDVTLKAVGFDDAAQRAENLFEL
eukprot:TRINITY_DN20877_c0_g1_i1.p1 TRINITY_DN20877_c0_g1~~TRINITY_DN20877_c0_g1_i1.p1  ORF type:complete len:759 (+),score=118.77 TRINITY_DN20877_c0_g1_i1:58-2277(+)